MKKRWLGWLTLFTIVIALAVLLTHRKPRVVTGLCLTANGTPCVASIRVCSSAAKGLPCLPLATIYSDDQRLMPKTQPFSSDAQGNYEWFAEPGFYIEQLTVETTTSHHTFTRTVQVP